MRMIFVIRFSKLCQKKKSGLQAGKITFIQVADLLKCLRNVSDLHRRSIALRALLGALS